MIAMPIETPAWAQFSPTTFASPAFILLILLEMWRVRATGRGAYEFKDSAASLTMGFGSTLAGILTGGIYVACAFGVYQFKIFEIGWTWWALVLCFFAEDLAYYWFHRLSHERRIWWAAHVVHHSSQHYNLSTALRQTWTGALALSFATKLPLFWIGFPPAMVFLFSGFSLVYQFWIHTEQIKRMGPLEWVLNTPSHHRVHHATNPRYLDANYAGVLIIWDRLFGTFIAERDEEPCAYGVVSNLGTFNPLRIAFHEWGGMVRDVASARGMKDVLGYVFGPPGWSPDGSRRTSKSIKEEWLRREGASTKNGNRDADGQGDHVLGATGKSALPKGADLGRP
jgi:sterol desaturase/sphingolipid hydroxylase (fatty acid hydroxylase superfamily)